MENPVVHYNPATTTEIITAPKAPTWSWWSLALAIIFFILLILTIIALVSAIVYFMNINNNTTQWQTPAPVSFPTITYPTVLPTAVPDVNNYDVTTGQMEVATVMSANNSSLGVGTQLPSYLVLINKLPSDLGLILAPASGVSSPFDFIVAFRGSSQPLDLKNGKNWSQVPYHNLGNVHQGLAGLADMVYDTVRNNVQNGRTVAFFGHATGAGVASLVAARLASEVNTITPVLYTSASPRIGDQTWESNLALRVPNRWILNNAMDNIPNIPFPTMQKGGTSYTYTTPAGDRIIIFSYQTGNIGNNDSLLTYQYALNSTTLAQPFPLVGIFTPPDYYCLCPT